MELPFIKDSVKFIPIITGNLYDKAVFVLSTIFSFDIVYQSSILYKEASANVKSLNDYLSSHFNHGSHTLGLHP